MTEAEAERFRVEALAEAEANKTRLAGQAEAEAALAKGKAEAEAKQKIANAFKEYGEAAVLSMVIDMLPQLMREAAQPLGNIEKNLCCRYRKQFRRNQWSEPSDKLCHKFAFFYSRNTKSDNRT